ncbi:hypothetical protein PRIPAC_87804 [Pristionchus pacificus]|uniref:Uncharacterized protein n=1 Tax=Pristionchus pacificus TaxID=54126 RepID=A0A454XX26_PRIPA|nr:hypothetical protein PRIPAC_87804 [Pristionchus pacificus]|eukprot:PDM83239.1 hypothetical protein PRIPAC_34871 [Pristionchus pacificus]
MTDCPIRLISAISTLLFLLGNTVSGAPMFDMEQNKIGHQRMHSMKTIVTCFQHYNKLSEGLEPSERKRYYASTSGATAVLYDEDGNEMDCSPHEKMIERPKSQYDQHCFFSPLNCFFSKYRLSPSDESVEYDVEKKRRN